MTGLPPATAADRNRMMESAAQTLGEARRLARPIPCLSRTIPDLTESEAYRIAATTIAARRTALAGYKLGYTSEAMRVQMGISEPNYGMLEEGARVECGGSIALAGLIHPRIEPEFAVRLGRDLAGPGVGEEEAWQAIEGVMPALEIVDTRYESYEFQAVDNIADNSSSARFVLGAPIPREALPDLRRVQARLDRNGTELGVGSGADVMGNPVAALAWLANRLGASGTGIRAGQIVLTGGVTRAFPAGAGDHFLARFDGLGTVEVRFQGQMP